MRVAKKAWTVDNKDLFIMLVVGQSNFEQDNSREKYMKCGSGIKLPEHYSVCQEKGTQKRRTLCMQICKNGGLSFTLIQDRNVGDPGTVV